MRIRLLTIAAVLALGLAAPLAAQNQFGGQLSVGDDTDFGLGARGVFGLQHALNAPLNVIASFDYFFPGSNVTYWELNGELAYVIPGVRGSVLPYFGAGLNLAHASVSGGGLNNSNTDLGLNLLAGTTFKTGRRITPFAEIRVELGGGDQFVVTGGVLF